MSIKQKIILILLISIVLIILQMIFSNIVKANTEITLTYIYNEDNTVTVKATSNIGFKETKPTWSLSKNKLTYIKKYNKNQSYYTDFVLANGVSKRLKINVTQIDDLGPNIKIQYLYDEAKDIVTVKLISNEVMADTKPTWSLSEDKLTYTKEYYSNQAYSTYVTDKYGNTSKVNLNITQIKGPQITIEYIHNKSDNTVTAKMKSNKILKETKPTWNLSKDKLTYTKNFDKNQVYTTPVYDIYDNLVNVKIDINLVDTIGSGISVIYNYNEDKSLVVVSLKSNEIMADTKPTWILSKDGLTYTKTFDSNQTYTTVVEDIYGNSTNVKISITEIKNAILNGIDVSLYQGTIDWSKVKKDNIDFVMVRAGYRGYGSNGTLVEDSMFSKNILGASTNGIDIGIYFYTQAITVEEAKEEAKFVLNLIKKYGIKITYPIAVDTELSTAKPEGTGRADNLSKDERTKIVKAFCDTIKDSGYIPMIYANKYWLNENLDMSKLTSYDVWLAHYTNQTDYKGSYTMWQYTDSGNVQGISGNVDKNYCYKKYN